MRQAQLVGQRRADLHQGVGPDQRRQAVAQVAVGIGRGQHFGRPVARADVEPAGAGGVTVLHPQLAGQPVVDVVVRQQDRRQARIGLRAVLAGPRQLGGGVAGQDRVAGQLDAALCAARRVHDLVALGGGTGVVPQLGRGQHVAALVERHESVLLPGHADGRHARAQRRIDPRKTRAHRVHPPVRALLAAAVVAGRQVQWLARGRDNLARPGVIDHELHALRAYIESSKQPHREIPRKS